MSRIVYYVIPEENGWLVVGEGATWTHATREAARRRATTYARCQWEICGRPGCVLVQHIDDRGFDRTDFGVDEDATAVSRMELK